jgi:hypothetical protein
MTFEMEKILEGKRALRRRLAALPIGEKLRMLDLLRDRSLEIAAVRARLRARKDGRSRSDSED